MCPKTIRSFRSGTLLLIVLAFATQSCAQAVSEETLCYKQRDQCERDLKAENRTAMRESCQICYQNCRPLAKGKRNRAHAAFSYCLKQCVDRDCIGRGTSGGVHVADEFRCHVYADKCLVEERVNNPVRKWCGTCAKACFYPSVRHHRDFCEGRCEKRNDSCAANPGTTVEDQCAVERAQCERDEKANNATAMRESCQNCYLNCAPARIGLNEDANYCLNTCLKHDCIGEETSNGVIVGDKFRCLVNKRRCEQDDNFRSNRNDLIKKSCGACANLCNVFFNRSDRNYCEGQCSVRNFSCVAKPRTIPVRPSASPKIPKPPPSRPTDPDTPSVNKPSDTPENATSNPKSQNLHEKLWQWLGPVLGAVATVAAAIITVVWVRDRNAKSAAILTNYPSTPPAVELGYDEGWPSHDYIPGVAEFSEQDVQQSASCWSKIFPFWS